MTVEAVNEATLIVELTPSDMQSYRLTYESLSAGEASEILKEILLSAGINRKGKAVIEALPNDDGGCFLIFTFEKTDKARYKIKNEKAERVFKFKSTDDLLDFLLVCESPSRGGKIKLYRNREELYAVCSACGEDLYRALSEFSKPCKISESVLSEHFASAGSVNI